MAAAILFTFPRVVKEELEAPKYVYFLLTPMVQVGWLLPHVIDL